MTRGHRRLHFAAWLVLTPAMLAVLIAAIVTRMGRVGVDSPGGRPQIGEIGGGP